MRFFCSSFSWSQVFFLYLFQDITWYFLLIFFMTFDVFFIYLCYDNWWFFVYLFHDIRWVFYFFHDNRWGFLMILSFFVYYFDDIKGFFYLFHEFRVFCLSFSWHQVFFIVYLFNEIRFFCFFMFFHVIMFSFVSPFDGLRLFRRTLRRWDLWPKPSPRMSSSRIWTRLRRRTSSTPCSPSIIRQGISSSNKVRLLSNIR